MKLIKGTIAATFSLIRSFVTDFLRMRHWCVTPEELRQNQKDIGGQWVAYINNEGPHPESYDPFVKLGNYRTETEALSQLGKELEERFPGGVYQTLYNFSFSGNKTGDLAAGYVTRVDNNDFKMEIALRDTGKFPEFRVHFSNGVSSGQRTQLIRGLARLLGALCRLVNKEDGVSKFLILVEYIVLTLPGGSE